MRTKPGLETSILRSESSDTFLSAQIVIWFPDDLGLITWYFILLNLLFGIGL